MTAEAMSAWAAQDEFTGILVPPSGAENRSVMGRPPHYVASRDFTFEVAEVLERSASPRDVADWIVDKMERFAAHMAEPVFTMDGEGPICSHCKTIWPLCGHHHQSQRIHELSIDEAAS